MKTIGSIIHWAPLFCQDPIAHWANIYVDQITWLAFLGLVGSCLCWISPVPTPLLYYTEARQPWQQGKGRRLWRATKASKYSILNQAYLFIPVAIKTLGLKSYTSFCKGVGKEDLSRNWGGDGNKLPLAPPVFSKVNVVAVKGSFFVLSLFALLISCGLLHCVMPFDWLHWSFCLQNIRFSTSILYTPTKISSLNLCICGCYACMFYNTISKSKKETVKSRKIFNTIINSCKCEWQHKHTTDKNV